MQSSSAPTRRKSPSAASRGRPSGGVHGHPVGRRACADCPWHPCTEARPDAVVLGYPVITTGEYRHDGSLVNLCGDDADLRATMSLENQVRDGLPPFFVWHTVEDPSVPVQNSLMLAGALTAIRSRWSCIFSPTTATAQAPARGRSTPPTSTTAPGWPSARTGWPKPLIFTCNRR